MPRNDKHIKNCLRSLWYIFAYVRRRTEHESRPEATAENFIKMREYLWPFPLHTRRRTFSFGYIERSEKQEMLESIKS